MKPYPSLYICLRTAALLFMMSSTTSAQYDWPGLKERVGNSGLRIGFEVSPEILGDIRYTNTAIHNANIGSAGVDWKTQLLHHQSRYYFDWTRSDAVVNFLRTNDIQICGTSLFWPNDQHLPQWVLESDPTDAADILEEHIDAVVGRYAPDVDMWIVANEIFQYDGSYRPGWWHSALGGEAIRLAFQLAAAKDPSATLIYNDHGLLELDDRKFNAVVLKLLELREAGVRVDGVGFQCHLTVGQILDPRFPMKSRIKLLNELGFQSHITELDILIPDHEDYYNPDGPEIPEKSAENLALQKNAYKKVVEIYKLMQPTGSIQIWGIADNQSWLGPEQFPLLFDENVERKPAYFGVEEALLGDRSGSMRLRHFWTGDYLYLPVDQTEQGAIVRAKNRNPAENWTFPPPYIDYDPDLDEGQIWQIERLDGDATYRISALGKNRFLNASGLNQEPVTVHEFQYDWTSQRWFLEEHADGRVLIRNAATDKFLQPTDTLFWITRINVQQCFTSTTTAELMGSWELEYLPKP